MPEDVKESRMAGSGKGAQVRCGTDDWLEAAERLKMKKIAGLVLLVAMLMPGLAATAESTPEDKSEEKPAQKSETTLPQDDSRKLRLCQIREIFSQKIPVVFYLAVFLLPPMAFLHDLLIGHLGNLLHAIAIDALVRKVGARGGGIGR